MADNIKTFREEKALYWAHNAHVVTNSYFTSAGSRLKKEYNNGYYVIATDFSDKATIRLLSGLEKSHLPHKKGLAFQLTRSLDAGTGTGIVLYDRLPATLTHHLRLTSIGIEGTYMSFGCENGFDALVVLGTVTPAVLQ